MFDRVLNTPLKNFAKFSGKHLQWFHSLVLQTSGLKRFIKRIPLQLVPGNFVNFSEQNCS